jgi:U3 small nucleolar ribonucleoprotein component
MIESELAALVAEALYNQALDPKQTESLASQLVWRVGRLQEDGPVTVRVGFATSARLFADLPKLKNATDYEVERAIKEGEIRVEWVGENPA